MTNKKSMKRALMSSVLILAMCFAMLAGTTYAWFTDSVTSAGNIIKSGKLDVELQWADGTADPAADATEWNDASEGAIFDYDKWEPGYVAVRHVRIANVGSLALKYTVRISANGEVTDLADVIDVYYIDPAVQVADRAALAAVQPIGTLTQVLAGMEETATGALAPKGAESDTLKKSSETITIALKMKEEAGNTYQNKSIGTSFSIQLLATQYTYEKDSFDELYDAQADGTPDNEVWPIVIVANDEEVAAAVNDLNTNEETWNEPVQINMGAGTYTQPITIEQFPNDAQHDSNNAGYVNVTNADSNQLYLKADGEAIIASPMTITGAGTAAKSGYEFLKQSEASVVIDGFTFEGVLQDGNVDTIIVTLDESPHNITFKNCTFKNQTHITVGGSGNNKAGLIVFENCTFDKAACFSGYYYDLRIINCTGNVDSGHGKGLINIQGGGNALVKGCTFDLGSIAYLVRTSGGGANVKFEDNAFTGTPALIVKLRGSNESVTFTNCTLNGAQVSGTSEGVDANSILTIE